jgi:hypothetical protein
MLFHEIMRDLDKSDAETIRVCCNGERLVLTANGRHVKAAFEVRRGRDPSQFAYQSKPTDRWPVCECYSMPFLRKVAKAKGVAANISIFLQPNFMIGFQYKTCIGNLSYMICPCEDEEWIENPVTRVMPPVCQDIVGIAPRTRMNSSKKRLLTEMIQSAVDDSRGSEEKDDSEMVEDNDENDSNEDENQEEEDSEITEDDEEEKRPLKRKIQDVIKKEEIEQEQKLAALKREILKKEDDQPSLKRKKL